MVEHHAIILMAHVYAQLAELVHIVQKIAQQDSGDSAARRSAPSARTAATATKPRGSASVRQAIAAAIVRINVLLDGLVKDASRGVLVRMTDSVTL